MDKKGTINLILFTIITGACGIIAQTLLLKEMLILFSGNELSIGVIIGSWILWEALGAYLAGLKHPQRDISVNIIIICTIIFSFLFPVSIYLTRVFKIIAGIPLDTGAGILHIFYASFFIMFPVGLLHGMLFTLICSFYNDFLNDGKVSIGRIYFYEMLGTILGGFLLNYILIQYFNAFTISVSLCAVSFISCLFLLHSFGNIKIKTFFSIVVLLLFSSFITIITGGTEVIHNYSVNKQWSGRNIALYKNSLYQNITVIKDHEQYTFFTDGVPTLTIPTPDISYIEDLVHFAMLSHNKPEHILVLSKGAGGIISEILKYKTVKRIDYVETDPEFLKTIELFSTSIVEKELKNPLVKLHFIDGRLFLKQSPSAYDIIFINVSLPYTIQTNRFFTEEFFENVKKALGDRGIGIISLPGSLTYYSPELKNLNGCILKTLESVFKYVSVIPGECNLYIFSEIEHPVVNSPQSIFERLKERGINTKLLNKIYIEDRIDRKRRDWFYSNLEGVSVEINKDFLPNGFFYTIAYNNLTYSPYLKPFFETIKRISFKRIIVGFLIMSFLFFTLSILYSGIPILYSIGTTGLTSIILELILIFAFQIHFGYVFFEVGILVTVFLTGIALGGIAALAPFMKQFRDIKAFRFIELILIILSLAVFLILKYAEQGLNSYPFLTKAIFFNLLFFIGLCTGIEFPIASRLYGENAKKEKSVGVVVGHLYSVDLIGGCIGGFFGGIILSVIGILEGCIALALLKVCSLLLLLKLRHF